MAKHKTVQPRKQRRRLGEAPLHVRRKQIASHLAEPLIIRYNRRSVPLVSGDTVRVMRGAFHGHEDKIASVDLAMRKVTVEGVTLVKADGTRVARPVDPSNLLITKLNLTDPRRRERLTITAEMDEEARKKLEKELEEEAEAQREEIDAFKERLAAEEAERKAKAREEGEAEAGVDPVTQEPIVRRRRIEESEEESEDEAEGAEEPEEGAPDESDEEAPDEPATSRPSAAAKPKQEDEDEKKEDS
jgi:large subunit ribosomal protein L24